MIVRDQVAGSCEVHTMNGRSSHNRCVPMRKALRRPELAAAFLKHALPADIAAPISTELPEVIDTSYVSPGLRHRYRDLLLRTHLKTGDELLVYIFFVANSMTETVPASMNAWRSS